MDETREQFLEEIQRNGDFLSEYNKQRTDDLRLKLMLNGVLQNTHALLGWETEKKNSEKSRRVRLQGNQSFDNNNYYQALQQFTESIMNAVYPSEELALAYANRSAALFKLEKYANCVDDIDRALNQKYPDRLKTKLYKRKGLSLTALGLPGAQSAFQTALHWVDKMQLSNYEMDEIRRELINSITGLWASAKPPKNVTLYPLPEIVSPNLEIPSASDAIAVKYSTKFGRHVVATRPIKPGEVLIVEKPFCSKLLSEHIYTHCSYCMKVSYAMIPCQTCINAAYCSNTCRNLALHEYHSVECSIGLMRGYKCDSVFGGSVRMAIMAILKFRTLDALSQELKSVDSNKDYRMKGYSNDRKFHSKSFRSIYSLPSDAGKCSYRSEEIRRLFNVALTLCILAKDNKIFGQRLTLDNNLVNNPDVIFVGRLILKLIEISCRNVHSYGGAPARSTTAPVYGHGILAVSSLLRHSCDTNVLKGWQMNHKVYYAACSIREGEEIFDCVGVRYTELSKDDRLARRNWLFQCECRACTEDWPLLQNVPSYAKQQLTKTVKDTLASVSLRLVELSRSVMDRGTLHDISNTLNELLENIDILSTLASKPCRELNIAYEMLRNFYQLAETVYDYQPANPDAVKEEQTTYYAGLLNLLLQT